MFATNYQQYCIRYTRSKMYFKTIENERDNRHSNFCAEPYKNYNRNIQQEG